MGVVERRHPSGAAILSHAGDFSGLRPRSRVGFPSSIVFFAEVCRAKMKNSQPLRGSTYGGTVCISSPDQEKISRIYNELPASQRSDWDEIIVNFNTWLSEVPKTGIEVKTRKTWQWPAHDSNSAESTSETENATSNSQPCIRLVLCETNALTGKMPNKAEVGAVNEMHRL